LRWDETLCGETPNNSVSILRQRLQDSLPPVKLAFSWKVDMPLVPLQDSQQAPCASYRIGGDRSLLENAHRLSDSAILLTGEELPLCHTTCPGGFV
jgi:hypothetical protein